MNLRKHGTLYEVLAKETQTPNPRQAAARIIAAEPSAEAFTLYKNRDEQWIVLPVGSAYELKNVGQASRAQASGKKPVAFCYAKNGNSATQPVF